MLVIIEKPAKYLKNVLRKLQETIVGLQTGFWTWFQKLFLH